MTKAEASYPGGCLCGAIRFVATGAPLWAANCHCQSCRRSAGAPFAAFVGFPPDRIAFTAGTPATYASSPGVVRSFCSDCGTPIAFEADRFAGETHLYVCTLDDPSAVSPTMHVHVGEQLAWLHLNDGLLRYRTSSRDGDPISDGDPIA